MKEEYDKEYFENTAEAVGLLLKERRPLWRRWVKIIRKYKASGKLRDVGCGEDFFLEYAGRYYDTHGMDISEYYKDCEIKHTYSQTISWRRNRFRLRG